MTTTEEISKHLSAFRYARESILEADADDIEHHLIELVAEIKRNPLCQKVLSALPQFDAECWWTEFVEADHHDSSTLTYPVDPDNKLSALWDLVSSMGSGDPQKLSFRGFGQTVGIYKVSDAASKSISLVIRPFVQVMTDRLRNQLNMANPSIRELAGVPLDAIPGSDETKIFLSHRSTDKELVRPYSEILKELGYRPWLDEHAMPAGTTLHRGITEGMDASCAAIFFVTPNFEDEKWVAREVDQAITRKVERGAKFSIITMVFDKAEVPRALREYLWINVTNQVEALRQVVRALPIELGAPRWKSGVYRK